MRFNFNTEDRKTVLVIIYTIAIASIIILPVILNDIFTSLLAR
jgi:hypothetical protein